MRDTTRSWLTCFTQALTLLAPPFVHPHPAPGLDQRRLDRGVRVLQPVLEGGVLGALEPVVRVPLQRPDLSDQCREVAGYVPGHTLRVLRSHLRAEHPAPRGWHHTNTSLASLRPSAKIPNFN